MIERKFIAENLKKVNVEDYLRKELEKCGIISIDIQRTPLVTRIGIKAERPGLIIGKKGKNISDIAAMIERELAIEKPQIEVVDITNPSLEPAIIARWIAKSLEKGLNPRKVAQRGLRRVMDAGAMGCEILLSGKLSGKGAKAKHNRVAAGYMKKAGESVKNVLEGIVEAHLKQGIVGIKVRIVPPNVVFPDKVDLKKMFAKPEEAKAEEKPAEEKMGEAPAPEAKPEEKFEETKPEEKPAEEGKEAPAEGAKEAEAVPKEKAKKKPLRKGAKKGEKSGDTKDEGAQGAGE